MDSGWIALGSNAARSGASFDGGGRRGGIGEERQRSGGGGEKGGATPEMWQRAAAQRHQIRAVGQQTDKQRLVADRCTCWNNLKRGRGLAMDAV